MANFRLTNPSEHPVTVRLDWIDLTALADGSYRPAHLHEREERSAAPYLTLSPAQFSLEPGEEKIITVGVRDVTAVEKLTSEHRSHLLIQTSKATSPLWKTGGGLPVDLAVSMSVPIILRAENSFASANIEKVWLDRSLDGGLVLKVALHRDGNSALTTRFTAALTKDFIAPLQIADADNLALYPEIDYRIISTPLGMTELPGGEIEIQLFRTDLSHDKLIARRIFALSPPTPSRQKPTKIRTSKNR